MTSSALLMAARLSHVGTRCRPWSAPGASDRQTGVPVEARQLDPALLPSPCESLNHGPYAALGPHATEVTLPVHRMYKASRHVEALNLSAAAVQMSSAAFRCLRSASGTASLHPDQPLKSARTVPRWTLGRCRRFRASSPGYRTWMDDRRSDQVHPGSGERPCAALRPPSGDATDLAIM